jgi:alkylation response protein AidB-like acyl-CoA dehydrogenase
MEFDWTPEDADFRKELKAFLDDQLPEYHEIFDLPPLERFEFSKAFAARLAERQWLTPAWPKEYGGLEKSVWQQLIISEEMIAHGEPRTGQYMNVNWIGPAIILAGTAEQKREHLTRISKGDVLWCQGFSEPDAGSDLASLRTRAVRDGDEFVINGEKIWTSNAGSAEMCFLLARTNTEVQKQRGISIFLIPTATPGFEIRDVHAIIHPGAFYHCILTDVRVPASCMLGPENEGFDIVRKVLANERVGVARYHRAAGYLDRVARWADERGLFDNPAVVATLASARAACEAARLLVYRVIDERAMGLHPQLTAYVYRVAAVRAERAVMDAAFEIMGPEGLPFRSFADSQFEWAITSGIAGGSYEMNLNSIGRLLGLQGTAKS